MTTAEIVANMLDGWNLDVLVPAHPVERLLALVLADPDTLVELADRFGDDNDRAVAVALAFHLLDERKR